MNNNVNFGNLPQEFVHLNESKIVIVPVPYDGTSTWIKGSDKGPKAIINASANMELYDIETDSEVYKKGIFTDAPVTENRSPEQMVEAVRKRVGKYLDMQKFVGVIGGEHSVSIGAIKAHSERRKDFCVLQLDAHADLREEYEGSKYNHSCVIARAKEMKDVVQVGIRSMDSSEKKETKNMFLAEKIYNNKEWIKDVIAR